MVHFSGHFFLSLSPAIISCTEHLDHFQLQQPLYQACLTQHRSVYVYSQMEHGKSRLHFSPCLLGVIPFHVTTQFLTNCLPQCSPETAERTNIYRLAASVNYKCESGTTQMVFYDPGLGTEGGWYNRLSGGAVGAGIDLNIQQLYTSLAMNYEDGDEIYLFGFSRGAYTVRSLAGMMNESGLLYRNKLDMVKDAYDLYRDNADPESEEAKSFREQNSRRVPIKLLVCFDTVGALGIPSSFQLPFRTPFRRRYEFHDTTLNESIEHAIHILSIDEDRESFLPTMMTHHPNCDPSQLTQKYFARFHSGVGGGSPDEIALSTETLLFVYREIEKRTPLSLKVPSIPRELLAEKVFHNPFFSMHGAIRFVLGRSYRTIESVDMVDETAINRYQNIKNWRPPALGKLEMLLESLHIS